MVKVIDETPQNQSKLDERRKLEKLAKENFGDEVNFSSTCLGNAFSVGKNQEVFFYGNEPQLDIKDKLYFDRAMKFAQDYEREFGSEEVVIKTDYSR